MKESTVNHYMDVYYAQDCKCIICGEEMDASGLDWSREHFWPKSRGGTEIVLAHEYCNTCKSDTEPTDEQMDRYNEWYYKDKEISYYGYA